MTTTQRRFSAIADWLLCAALTFVGCVQAQPTDVDPPGRVARLAEVNGQVWLYSPDAGEWVAARRNLPLTSGDRVATEPGARVELQIGSSTVRVDSASELEIVHLDDERVALDLHDGSAFARVRDPTGAGRFELTTDAGRFIVQRTGTYRIDRNNGRSDLTVYSGQARYEGPNSGLQVDAAQRAEFWIDANGVAQYSMSAPVNDAFAGWNNDRDRRFAGAVAERYVSPEMTGAAELDVYGRWEQTPDYGSVWIPTTVAVDWAPYSQGHWAWVRPWGWTWIDDAPWGFAPFHYGRWVFLRSHWCWTPGVRVSRPVYAPALVAWVGGPRGNGSVAVGGGPAVGWFPLAPREVYVPSYRVSSRYARNLNITTVTNVTVINEVLTNPLSPREFQNRRSPGAVTVVPSNVMVDRRPVGPAAAQLRLAPWVREVATQPGRTAALLAPPVATPMQLARGRDPRAVLPPPGSRPDVTERRGAAGPMAGTSQDRERSEPERQQELRPPGYFSTQPAAMPVGREAERGGFGPGQRAPATSLPQPPGLAQPMAPQSAAKTGSTPVFTAPPFADRMSPPVEPGWRRPEFTGPSRGLREREGNERVLRPPSTQPAPLPATAPPPRSAVISPSTQDGPSMRALPIQRPDDRREERRDEERRPPQRLVMPPPLQAQSPAPSVQSPAEQRALPPLRTIDRPAARMAPMAPMAPAMPQMIAPRSVDVPRPSPPGAAAPAAPRIEPPRAQRPDMRGDDPRRGDARDVR